METTIQENLKKAIFLENRGFNENAKSHYNLLKNHFHLLDEEALTRISKFYCSQGEYNTAFKVSKLAIKKLGNLTILAPLYIYAWENIEADIECLEWLLIQPGMNHLIQEKLIVARHLFIAGKTDKSYMISLEIAEQMELNFKSNPSEYELYINVVLNLVELEYIFENFVQSRFHLRKLVYLVKERLSRIQDIAYWAALLDEIASFVTRPDWEELKQYLSGDVLLISKFYQQLSQQKLTRQTVDLLKNKSFSDDALELKRNTYLHLITKMSGQETWYKGIEQEHLKKPNDLLTSLLYADYIKNKQSEKLKLFWQDEFPKHADRPEAIKAYWNASKNLEENKNETNLDNCQITFLGGGEKIGGTSILVSIKGHHLLLDAGMHLNEEVYHPNYTPMYEQGISFKDIDALLITHAHMDHTGAVPYIRKKRRDLPIYATEATTSLMKLLLGDSARIGKEGNPNMYTEQDVQNVILSIKSVDFYQTFAIPAKDDEWKITYYPSGHILGAAAIHIEIKGVSVLFTGDYSIDEQKTVKGLDLPSDLSVDILITESTYGFLPTNASIERSRQEKIFVESIKRTMEKEGSMLIPAFAVGRAQEIILILKDAFKEEKYLPFNLFLDGRVIDVCRIYQRFAEQKRYINPKYYQNEEEELLFFGSGVQSAQDIYSNHRNNNFSFEDFIEDYILSGNNCIVASSGMLTDNSASARYAEKLIEEERNAISFTGYMDEESPGKHVLQTAKIGEVDNVKVNGSEKELHARIESFRLSAHASREQILQLIADLQPKRVFLMHGEHMKRFESIQTIVEGEKIYPSLIDLLSHLKDEISVTAAYNGRVYQLNERGQGKHGY